MTLIEAMWSALPIVTTATAGMKDVVRDEHNGLLTAPGDVESLVRNLEKLTRDPRIAPGIGHCGPQDGRDAFHVEPNG